MRVPSAEEISRYLAEEGSPVGKATVYRCLDRLVEQGTVRKFLLGEGESACYQYQTGECHSHYHLKCACCGALLGYLRFNLHPAQVIMGDTGSMFLGGLMAAVAIMLRLPLLIPIAGGAYAVSLLSVFLQRIYFKATHGKRIFKMAPLHHHFELCGWSEVKLVTIFTLVSAVFCMLALWGVIGRYHF